MRCCFNQRELLIKESYMCLLYSNNDHICAMEKFSSLLVCFPFFLLLVHKTPHDTPLQILKQFPSRGVGICSPDVMYIQCTLNSIQTAIGFVNEH